MYATSDEFRQLASGSHHARFKLDIINGDDVLAEDVPVIGGAVTMDSGRTIRSSMTATFAPDSLVPLNAEALLYPASNELRPYKGIVVGGGIEWVPLGVFSFEDVDIVEDSNGLALQVNANDRGWLMSRSRLVDPVVIAKDTLVPDAINDLLDTVPTMPALNDLASSVLVDDNQMPLVVYQPEGDPWGIAVNIATAFGLQLYCDREGVPTLDVIPDPDNFVPSSTFDVDAGAPVMSVNRNLSTADTYNGVVAMGEGSDLVRPLRAEVWDTDESSPFYYEGPYGKKPYFYSSPLILTLNQANSAARAKLKQIIGSIDALQWSMVCNPALDVYDVVSFKRDNVGVNDTFVLESVTIPFNAEQPMTCSGRTSILTTEAAEL